MGDTVFPQFIQLQALNGEQICIGVRHIISVTPDKAATGNKTLIRMSNSLAYWVSESVEEVYGKLSDPV